MLKRFWAYLRGNTTDAAVDKVDALFNKAEKAQQAVDAAQAVARQKVVELERKVQEYKNLIELAQKVGKVVR